jgi:hypothetical protein
MIIEVPAEVRKEIIVNVHIDDVIQEINKLKIETRFNYVAKLLNEIYSKDLATMTDNHKDIIVKYLTMQLNRFQKPIEK